MTDTKQFDTNSLIKDDANQAPAQGLWSWIGALLLAGAAAFYLANLKGSKSVGDMAVMAGEFLVYALLASAVFYSLFKQRRGAKYFVPAFLCLYLAMLAGGNLGAEKQRKQGKIAMAATQEEMQKLTKAIEKANNNNDGNVLSSVVDAKMDTTQKASGDFGEMEKFMKTFINSALTMKNNYVRELDAIGWGKVLDFQRIKNDAGMAESKAIIEKAKATVSSYIQKTDALFVEGNASIDKLNLSDGQKQDMRTGFNRGAVKSREQIMANWEWERQIIGEVEGMLNLLANKKRWKLDNGQVMFYNQSDLDQFNAHNATIAEIGKKQVEAQKRQIEKSTAEFDKLKKTME